MSYQTLVRKPILAGTTPRIRFQIIDEDGLGFKPASLQMTIYDVDFSVKPATQAVVNSQNDIDVLDSCDADGNVELILGTDDTAVDVPTGCKPATRSRRVLFTWNWDDDKVGKHEVVLTIAPDRETVAS